MYNLTNKKFPAFRRKREYFTRIGCRLSKKSVLDDLNGAPGGVHAVDHTVGVLHQQVHVVGACGQVSHGDLDALEALGHGGVEGGVQLGLILPEVSREDGINIRSTKRMNLQRNFTMTSRLC